MNRQIITVVLAMVVSLTLMGCGLSNPENATENDSKTLTFWTLQLKDFANLIEPMLDEFEAEHPGVIVEWVDVPFSQGEKRMLTAVMSGQVPDVVNLNPEFSALLAQRGALLDMNVAASPDIKSRYVPAVWNAVSTTDASLDAQKPASTVLSQSQSALQQTSKTAVGLPWYVTSRVLVVNQKLLKQVGWSQLPKTMDDLARLMQDVSLYNQAHPTQPTVYAMMPPLGKSGYVLKQLFLDGVIDDWTQLDSLEAVAWLERWVHWYQQGVLPAESATEGPQAVLDRYQSGQLILMEAGANYLTMVRDNAPGVYANTVVAKQWAPSSGRVSFSTMLLAVPAQSQYPQLATELAAFVTQGKYQLQLAKAAPVLPSVGNALNDAYFIKNLGSDDPKASEARRLSALQLSEAQKVLPNMPRQKEAFAWVDHYVQSALLGTMNTADALSAARAKLSQLWGTE